MYSFYLQTLYHLCQYFILVRMFTHLLDEFTPSHYDISLDLNRDTSSFSGTVKLDGDLSSKNEQIKIHGKNLNIVAATVDGKAVDVTMAEFDVIELTSTTGTFDTGNHHIEISYTGKIQTEAMHGIYESRFKHEDKLKKIIVTQFESHHAREAFPCIDEPGAKASFKLSITSPDGEPVLSNTPIESTRVSGSRVTTTFEQTPVMSTYLVAFAFGDMHCVEGKTKDGIIMRTWASVAQPKSWLTYSLQEGIKILEFFTEYFDTPFPLKKCDQIALPDFDSGAMENWGMVTYREIALVSDPDNRSISTEQYVSLVVAHELSHQWFGNLVTMKWWDDLWLNESFASMMEHLALDALHPEWHQWEEYTASDVISTSNRDIFSDVQAVRVEVGNPELIETLFDPAIVYAKGGRLLKMLREYIGDEAFRTGLKSYFTKHAYQNTTRDDLWVTLSESSGKDINALMNPWLEQSGLPVLSVSQENTSITVSQERFVLDRIDDQSSWVVPLLANQTLFPPEISARQSTVQCESSDYVLLNQYGSGHYLVKYTKPEHMRAIVSQLQNDEIPTEGKINLFNDQILLSKRGDVSIVEAMDLAIGNANEQRESVWSLMGMIFGVARSFIEGDEGQEQMIKQIMADLLQPHYEQLGWERRDTDDANDTHMRVVAVAAMIHNGRKEAVDTALSLFTAHVDNLEALPGDLRTVILATAVKHHPNHRQIIEELLQAYQKASSADLQLDITSALCNTKIIDDVRLYIDQAIGKNGFVRQQDFIRWIALMAGNHYVRPALWDFFEANWSYVKQQLNGSKSYDYFPIYAARGLNTAEWKERYVAFFTPKLNEPVLERNINVALNDIQARIDWRTRDEPKVRAWITKQ